MSGLKALACAGLLLLGGCGQPSGSSSDLDYIRFSSSSWGLSRKIHERAIKYCINGADTTENARTAELAISSWLNALRYLDDTVTAGVEKSCNAPDVTMNWKTYEGRASASTGYGTSTMTLFSNSQFRTVQHELGHSFGLGDTYFAEGQEIFEPTLADAMDKGNGDRPESVMKLGRYGKVALYPDDIEGIQSILMLMDPGSVFGAEEACITAAGETGVRRSINRGQRFTACRPTKAYHQMSHEPAYSACVDGKTTYGLYDQSAGEWLPGVARPYPCSSDGA